MKRVFRWIIVLVAVVAFIGHAVPVSAHRSGCHRWHSCPSDSGSYVCGDLGYTSGCPSAAPTPTVQTIAPPPTPAPTPKIVAPVITTKTVITEQDIAYVSRIKLTDDEYPGYSKVTQIGVLGKNRIFTDITYSNGIETSRQVAKSEVVVPKQDELVAKGSRLEPTATLTAFSKTTKQNKFDIKGTYKKNSTVVLSLDGKRIKRAKTDQTGKFVFKGIKVTSKHPKVAIFNRIGRTETRISEAVSIDKAKSAIQTEYEKLHPVVIQKAVATVVPSGSARVAPIPKSTPIPTPAPVPLPKPAVTANCDPNYKPCIPNVVGDLNCADIRMAVTVIGVDRYNLDADSDTIGCESYQ